MYNDICCLGLCKAMSYRFIVKPEDLAIPDILLFLDLSVILTFACFAGTSILSGKILSNICLYSKY